MLQLPQQVLEVQAVILLRLGNAGVRQLPQHMFKVQAEVLLRLGEINVYQMPREPDGHSYG